MKKKLTTLILAAILTLNTGCEIEKSEELNVETIMLEEIIENRLEKLNLSGDSAIEAYNYCLEVLSKINTNLEYKDDYQVEKYIDEIIAELSKLNSTTKKGDESFKNLLSDNIGEKFNVLDDYMNGHLQVDFIMARFARELIKKYPNLDDEKIAHDFKHVEIKLIEDLSFETFLGDYTSINNVITLNMYKIFVELIEENQKLSETDEKVSEYISYYLNKYYGNGKEYFNNESLKLMISEIFKDKFSENISLMEFKLGVKIIDVLAHEVIHLIQDNYNKQTKTIGVSVIVDDKTSGVGKFSTLDETNAERISAEILKTLKIPTEINDCENEMIYYQLIELTVSSKLIQEGTTLNEVILSGDINLLLKLFNVDKNNKEELIKFYEFVYAIEQVHFNSPRNFYSLIKGNDYVTYRDVMELSYSTEKNTLNFLAKNFYENLLIRNEETDDITITENIMLLKLFQFNWITAHLRSKLSYDLSEIYDLYNKLNLSFYNYLSKKYEIDIYEIIDLVNSFNIKNLEDIHEKESLEKDNESENMNESISYIIDKNKLSIPLTSRINSIYYDLFMEENPMVKTDVKMEKVLKLCN